MKDKDLSWGSYVKECLLEIAEGESTQELVDGVRELMAKLIPERLARSPKVQNLILESGEVAANKGLDYAQRKLKAL